MKQATQEQRATVHRAIHIIFTHLTPEQIDAMKAAQAAVNYAGAQLGTSSQALAGTEKRRVIDSIVAGLSDFYVIEAAEYIDPRVIYDR